MKVEELKKKKQETYDRVKERSWRVRGGCQVLAHVSKLYARDFLVHICALTAILRKIYK